MDTQLWVLRQKFQVLLFDLETRRALATDNVEVVVRRNEDGIGLALDFGDDGFALGACRSAEDDFRGVGFCAFDFGGGADAGHDDVGGDVERGGCEG